MPLGPIRRRCCAAALALALPGCAAFERSMADRLLDVTDVVDFKYGRGYGLGFKFELSLYFGTGLGIGVQEFTREWFGRRGLDFTLQKEDFPGGWVDGLFFHAGVIGVDGGSLTSAAQSALCTVGLNLLMLSRDTTAPPLIDRWRFGAEVQLPGALGGMYLNFGEVWDLVAGVFGGDPAEDDGVKKEVLPLPEE